MADKMVKEVMKRGRAYRCTLCGYTEIKSRVEQHFYHKHVAEYEVPFLCAVCNFRTGDNDKFTRHQESPLHQAKVDPLTESVCLQVSQVPRTVKYGEDVTKLTRTDSAQHWMSVACVESGERQAGDTVEDIRVQLLTTEPMVVTPPQEGHGEEASEGEGQARMVETTDKGTNTDAIDPASFDLLCSIDENLKTMNGYMRDTLKEVYGYVETLAVMNRRQEEVMHRLEKRLDKYDEEDRKGSAERERRRREERDREERERRMKEDRFRGRDGRRSRDRK